MKVSPARYRSAAGRRAFLSRVSALAGAAVLPGCGTTPERADVDSSRERNKAIALRFKHAQAEKDGEATIAGLLLSSPRSPTRGSLQTRGGMRGISETSSG